jgi:Na+/H+-dicarboxylate symporter
MTLFVNLLTIALIALAGVSLTLGVIAIGDEHDLQALYWLVMGALLLKSSVEMVRPSRSG